MTAIECSIADDTPRPSLGSGAANRQATLPRSRFWEAGLPPLFADFCGIGRVRELGSDKAKSHMRVCARARAHTHTRARVGIAVFPPSLPIPIQLFELIIILPPCPSSQTREEGRKAVKSAAGLIGDRSRGYCQSSTPGGAQTVNGQLGRTVRDLSADRPMSGDWEPG